MGQKLRTNVRELEGALNRVIAWQKLTLRPITVDAVRETLQDLFASFDYLITIENIQRIVAEYYGIKVADIKSKSRARSVARPRQIAMALAKNSLTIACLKLAENLADEITPPCYTLVKPLMNCVIPKAVFKKII